MSPAATVMKVDDATMANRIADIPSVACGNLQTTILGEP
jgi:hypothetical protein